MLTTPPSSPDGPSRAGDDDMVRPPLRIWAYIAGYVFPRRVTFRPERLKRQVVGHASKENLEVGTLDRHGYK